MKIKVHSKLFWQNEVYWLVSEKSRLVENRPNHDRYSVVPWQEYNSDQHSYIRFIDVPKNMYAVMGTKTHEIEVKEE